MRTIRYILLLFRVVFWIQGCSPDPGDPTGGEDDGPPPAPAPAEAVPRQQAFATRALARARSWVDAQVPYCGGPNGGTDVICGGTCSRTGPSSRPDWDEYRSDCSGFVSWAWGLPAPGRTTTAFAPEDAEISAVIAVKDLMPGDALSGKGHVMLFGGWVDEHGGKATVLEESRCGLRAREEVMTFAKVDATTLRAADGRVFRPIRYGGARAE